MPRRIPPPPATFEPLVGQRPWRIGLTLVTPMLGGGHKPREIDQITPISVKAIRGHLRFWWRYMCGSRLESPLERSSIELMRLRESEVFGGQDMGSPFDLVVENVRFLRLEENRGGNGAEGYVFFPLRKEPKMIALAGLQFTLVVQWIGDGDFTDRLAAEARRREENNRERSFPAPFDSRTIRDQLNLALWAWVSFGGLGSRTRRGLGCLKLTEADGIGCHSFEKGGKPRNSGIPEIYYSTNRFSDDPSKAWNAALSAYRDFRQTPRGARKSKSRLKMDRNGLRVESLGKVQGRTRWPEADSIRMATGCALAPATMYLKDGRVSATPTAELIEFGDHTAPTATGGTLPAYPRAALGLPIIFHFADGPKLDDRNTFASLGVPPSQRDPDEATLVPTVMDGSGQMIAGDRMASPVITKPILLHDGWHAAVIILRPQGLHQLQAQLNSTAGPTPISSAQIMGPAVRGFAPMLGKENALDALGLFLSSHGFIRYGASK